MASCTRAHRSMLRSQAPAASGGSPHSPRPIGHPRSDERRIAECHGPVEAIDQGQNRRSVQPLEHPADPSRR